MAGSRSRMSSTICRPRMRPPGRAGVGSRGGKSPGAQFVPADRWRVAARVPSNACAHDAAAGPHCRAHGAGAIDPGIADLLQRGGLEGGQRTARQATRTQFEKQHGAKLGFMSFFTKACVEALEEIPLGECLGRRQRTSSITSISTSVWPCPPTVADRADPARRRSVEFCRHREIHCQLSPRAHAPAPSPWRN